MARIWLLGASILVLLPDAAQAAPAFNPPLIGQGLPTKVGQLIVPKASLGTEQYLGLGVNLYAGKSNSKALVSIWGWCETGPNKANCFGANFGTQWASGSPDVSSQAVEIDYNNNSMPNFRNYHNGLNIFSGGRYPGGIGAFIGASVLGQNNWIVGLEISSYRDTGLIIANNLHSVPGTGGAIIQQPSDGANTIVVQRAADSTPKGNLLTAVDTRNATMLFNLDASGNLILTAGFERPAMVYVAQLGAVDPYPQAGDRLAVIDAETCVIDQPVHGGGAKPCALIYSGSTWKAVVSN